MDIGKRPMAPGGAAPVRGSTRGERPCWTRLRPYRDGRVCNTCGLDERGVAQRLLADPRLLRLPLVRYGNDVTAGPAEATWGAWLGLRAAPRDGCPPSTRDHSRSPRGRPDGRRP